MTFFCGCPENSDRHTKPSKPGFCQRSTLAGVEDDEETMTVGRRDDFVCLTSPRPYIAWNSYLKLYT